MHAQRAGGGDVAFVVVEEHGVGGLVDTELFQCGVVDRGVGFAHADLARVDHRVEQLVDGDHLAPRAAVLGDVVGHHCGADAAGAHRAHEVDDDGAVEGVLGHAAEQLAGIEPDARLGGIGGDLREGFAEPELAALTLVPRVVGVGVIRAEHQVHQVLGLDALGGGVLVDGLERRAGEHTTEVEQHRFDRRSHPPFLPILGRCRWN